MELFEKLKVAEHKFRTDHKLPMLGILAISGGNSDENRSKSLRLMIAVNSKKDSDFFSGITSKQR